MTKPRPSSAGRSKHVLDIDQRPSWNATKNAVGFRNQQTYGTKRTYFDSVTADKFTYEPFPPAVDSSGDVPLPFAQGSTSRPDMEVSLEVRLQRSGGALQNIVGPNKAWPGRHLGAPDDDEAFTTTSQSLAAPSQASEPQRLRPHRSLEPQSTAANPNEEFRSHSQKAYTSRPSSDVDDAISASRKLSSNAGIKHVLRGSVYLRKRTTIEELQNRQEFEDTVQELYDATQNQPNLRALAEFLQWCIKKFKNLTRCWRSLDSDKNMKLSSLEFYNSLKTYGWEGNVRKLFKILDRDKSGTLMYYHFDPCGAHDLASVLDWCNTNFGSVQKAFKAFDVDGNGFVTLREFTSALEERGLRSCHAHACLFEMLDLNDDRKIQSDELAFLDKWKCPGFLKVAPDFEAAKQFKAELLAENQGNPIKAWLLSIDVDRNMCVSWDEFEKVCEGRQLGKEKWDSVWRAYDNNLSGWLSLREFDEQADVVLKRFMNMCLQTYGSTKDAFLAIDKRGDGTWSKKDFRLGVAEPLNLDEKEADLLFNGLDLSRNRTAQNKPRITLKNLAFLQNWDVAAEEEDNKYWDIVANTLQKKMRQSLPTTKNEDTKNSSEGGANAKEQSEGISQRLQGA